MSDRGLYTAFGASLLIHLTLVPAASVRLQNNSSVPITIPVKLVDMPRVEEVEEPESFSREPLPKPKAQKITAPKLLSKPEIFKTRSSPTTGNIKEQIKEPEKPVEQLPPLASLRPDPDSLKGGWKSGSEAWRCREKRCQQLVRQERRGNNRRNRFRRRWSRRRWSEVRGNSIGICPPFGRLSSQAALSGVRKESGGSRYRVAQTARSGKRQSRRGPD